MKQRSSCQPACGERLGSPLSRASFDQMTSKAGFSGRWFGFQRSSIKELMGVGWGTGPSVLDYPECARPGAGWHGGSRALPTWSSWLPFLSCLALFLSAAPDSESLLPLLCLPPLSLRSRSSCPGAPAEQSRDGEQEKWGVSGLVLQMQSLRQDS